MDQNYYREGNSFSAIAETFQIYGTWNAWSRWIHSTTSHLHSFKA